jgi:hypothetical protein
MGLIVEGPLQKEYAVEGLHVGVYLVVPRKYLSDMFLLNRFTYYTVKGVIEDIKKAPYSGASITPEELDVIGKLRGSEVEFVLSPALIGSYDRLYISNKSWELFRDYAIIPKDYILRVKLTRITIDKEKSLEKDIYPYRDVVAV